MNANPIYGIKKSEKYVAKDLLDIMLFNRHKYTKRNIENGIEIKQHPRMRELISLLFKKSENVVN